MAGSPTFSSTSYKEGSSSLKVNDAASMPGRSMELSTNSISISALISINASAAGEPVLVDNEKILVWYDEVQKKLFAGLLGSSTVVGIENIATETWYHVVVTYDGTELKLYLNGGSETNSIGGLSDNVSGSSAICLASTFGPRPWDGYIDDIIVYGRALTASEVSDIYSSY